MGLRTLRAALLAALGCVAFESEAFADEPPTQPAPPAAPTDPKAPPPDPPPPPSPIDVSVREPPRAPEAVSFTRAEARQLPGAFGDPFRVVEALPGVVPIASGLPYFYIRGAPPGDVGYFLDGIRVPLLFHLGLGPAVVHPGLISNVELDPDGSNQLGRYAGGMVSADLAEPRPEIHGEANIRIVDAGALLEVPFANGKGDALVAGRYSYTGPLFSLIRSDSSLAYGDYAARFSYELKPGQRLGIFAFGAYDYLGQKDSPDSKVTRTLVDTMFHRIDVRYDQKVSDSTQLRHDVILGWEETGLGSMGKVVDKMLDVKSAMVHRVSPELSFNTGVDVTVDDIKDQLVDDTPSDCRVASCRDEFIEFFKSRVDLAVGAYAEATVNIASKLNLTPAIRFDLYTSGNVSALGVDPRVSLQYDLLSNLFLSAYAGLSSQRPSFILSGPGFTPPLDDKGLQHTFSTTIGLEWKPEPTWTVKATLYRSTFFSLNDALGTSTLGGGFPDGLGGFGDRFNGTAEGIEMSMRRRLTRNLGGILAYTIGRSDRIGLLGEHLPSGFDRTHVASVALSYDFTKGFRGSIKNLFYTGTPILQQESSSDSSIPRVVNTGMRIQPFYRLDVRVEKRFQILKKGYLSIVLEMLNTFASKETVGVDCSSGQCTPQQIGPVAIPSIGVEGGF